MALAALAQPYRRALSHGDGVRMWIEGNDRSGRDNALVARDTTDGQPGEVDAYPHPDFGHSASGTPEFRVAIKPTLAAAL